MKPSSLSDIRTILFDAGNTLTFVDLGRVREVLASLGHPVSLEVLEPLERLARASMYEQFETNGGGSDRDRWATYLRNLLHQLSLTDSDLAREVQDRLARLHRAHSLWNRVADGAPRVLSELRSRGFRLGVVSNSDGRVQGLLEELRLAHHFEVIIDSHLVGVEKPDPAIFWIALERIRAEARETLYVGDFCAVDVEGARAAGLLPVLLDPLRSSPRRDCLVVVELQDLIGLLPDRPAAVTGEE